MIYLCSLRIPELSVFSRGCFFQRFFVCFAGFLECFVCLRFVFSTLYFAFIQCFSLLVVLSFGDVGGERGGRGSWMVSTGGRFSSFLCGRGEEGGGGIFCVGVFGVHLVCVWVVF